jgi:hypothetical protein
MRPNLAFGPIDSLAQYLLYLSIVVLGVLLPILVHKWRQRRQEAQLAQRTLVALRSELATNRDRLEVSRDSFVALAAILQKQHEEYQALWHRLGRTPPGDAEEEPPAFEDVPINIPMLTRTAWDVAHVSHALVLLPSQQLATLTRAYYLQSVLAETRVLQLDVAMKLEALETPLDLRRRINVEARLQALAIARAAVRYQISLSNSALEAYVAALSGIGDPQPGA